LDTAQSGAHGGVHGSSLGGQGREDFDLKTSLVKFNAKEYMGKGFRAKPFRAILGP
jgi:hypothetical protein